MYNILIVGHGNFATGMKSAFDLLLGDSDRVYAQDLSEDITHEKFENIVTDYLNKHDQLIVFADLMGGAPSQIVTRKIAELARSKEQFVVSGVSLGIMIDIATNILVLNDEDNMLDKINNSLDLVRSTMGVMSLCDFENEEEDLECEDMI
ncbi:PTS mannose transporter subunit IID [Clostridium sp. CCUG 7971]|uniref:PTS sugar transporter subunit IIA n=1 Tax=Clostridium sp. CCUG 7971 TaxID=2811414 RepID=UPI001ABADE6C|nr:PTS mannose transporter subunit IID [Clostridium sp. CCUG 7971]MBO3444779.1 PTS mannose transporter subunit IID [Clostridium sp. CCUG 7971]